MVVSSSWPIELDGSINPGDDFYKYVNNKWLAANPIPDDYSRYGTFEVLMKDNQERLNNLVSSLPDDSLVKIYNTAGNDEETLNKNGFSPVLRYLEQIDKCSNKDELWKMTNFYLRHQIKSFFGVHADADDREPSFTVLHMMERGTYFNDRDYYLEESKKPDIAAYKLCLSKLFALTPISKSTSEIDEIVKFETLMAESKLTKEQRRDPQLTYNAIDLSELQKLAPVLDWSAYFGELQTKKILTNNPKFITNLNSTWTNTDLSTLKSYFQAHLLTTAASLCHNEAFDILFDLNGKQLAGQKLPKPRWKRVLSKIDSTDLGELLGKDFVEKYFPKDSKQKALDMVEYIRRTLGERIETLPWMGDATKEKAKQKLNAFNVKIGYPDRWTDFSSLVFTKDDSFFDINMKINVFEYEKEVARLYKPVDKHRWFMNPHTVNAYYNPTANEIVFPAGILMEPFFSPNFSDAENFGAIGGIIGHEMTHGFDDQGCQYDYTGALENWWTTEDSERYKKKTTVVKEQYDAFEIEGGKVNGQFTLGENIADIGGLKITFLAMQSYYKEKHGRDDIFNEIEGEEYSPAKLCFIAWSRGWTAHTRREETLKRLTTDPHSPNYFRVNGVVANIPEFWKTFGVTDKEPLYLGENVAEIW